MSHNPGQVLMGTTLSNVREVSNILGLVVAGTAIRLDSSGEPSTTKADGELVGVSLGRDLSNTGRTAYVTRGLKVPVILTAAFVPVIGAAVHISDTTGLAAASGAGATATRGVYCSGELVGLAEDGSTVRCALIDFEGGL